MFLVSNEIRKEIIEYCREVTGKLNIDYLKESFIFRNEFLETLYVECIFRYETYESYTLTNEQIAFLFSVKKRNEFLMNQIKDENLVVYKIDENDNLIIKEK